MPFCFCSPSFKFRLSPIGMFLSTSSSSSSFTCLFFSMLSPIGIFVSTSFSLSFSSSSASMFAVTNSCCTLYSPLTFDTFKVSTTSFGMFSLSCMISSLGLLLF
uniref:Uncharacterized protein n=1 Tax=Cacopsylla melanoneura TaxID=428564 RepID=A0A8D8PQP2_9HEMI